MFFAVSLFQDLPNQVGTNIPSLSCYLAKMFPFFITLVASLAVLMFAWGGLEHMFSRVPGGVGEGTKRMKQALFGLLLALSGWLILHEINPKITDKPFLIGGNSQDCSRTI